MKKGVSRHICILVTIIVLGLAIVQLHGILSGSSKIINNNLKKYALHEYTIEAEFLEEEQLLEVKQQVQYRNSHNISFEEIYFHLYPNAFQQKEKLPFPKNEMNRAYPSGFEPGYIKIQEVMVEGQKVEYEVEGYHNSALEIALEKELEPNEEIIIDFTYQVKIPPVASRFGYGENTYNLGNWYPIAAVYDHKGWNLEPYHAVGDPFYSDISNYEVTLILPEKFELATTGNIVKTNVENNKDKDYKEKTWRIQADGVRDFAWVISENFKMKRDKVDGTTINVYYFEGQQGDKALEASRDAIEIFNKKFGKYPYEQFSVVSSDFYIGGMEYPNLVYIDESIFSRDNTTILEYIIVHEAAHQWWYGIVGNDQVNEPWLDEAITEYSTMLYFREKYGEETMMQLLKAMIVDDYTMTKAKIGHGDESIARRVDEFKDNREYSGIVYSKGAMMFLELENQVGRENMETIMQYYMKENKFTNVTEDNIKMIVRAVMGEDYDEFFRPWLEGDRDFLKDDAA